MVPLQVCNLHTPLAQLRALPGKRRIFFGTPSACCIELTLCMLGRCVWNVWALRRIPLLFLQPCNSVLSSPALEGVLV